MEVGFLQFNFNTLTHRGFLTTNSFKFCFISTCFINRTLKFHSLNKYLLGQAYPTVFTEFLLFPWFFHIVLFAWHVHVSPFHFHPLNFHIPRPIYSKAIIAMKPLQISQAHFAYFFQVPDTLSLYY